jgi:hypothetical protein
MRCPGRCYRRHGRLRESEHGRCPAGMANPTAGAEQERSCGTLPDTSAVAVCHPVQVPDTADGLPRPLSARRVRRLQEPVARSAAAGGMQPAPMDTGDPCGQAAAELATDIGHRRPGERAGLLEAEVVDL